MRIIEEEELSPNAFVNLSRNDINDLAMTYPLSEAQLLEAQAQLQGARRSSRIASQAPTTPVGRGTTTLDSQLSPHVENYLSGTEPPSADIQNYLRDERRKRRERGELTPRR